MTPKHGRQLVAGERERRIGVPRDEVIPQYLDRESHEARPLAGVHEAHRLQASELFLRPDVGINDDLWFWPPPAAEPPPDRDADRDGREQYRQQPPREGLRLPQRARGFWYTQRAVGRKHAAHEHRDAADRNATLGVGRGVQRHHDIVEPDGLTAEVPGRDVIRGRLIERLHAIGGHDRSRVARLHRAGGVGVIGKTDFRIGRRANPHTDLKLLADGDRVLGRRDAGAHRIGALLRLSEERRGQIEHERQTPNALGVHLTLLRVSRARKNRNRGSTMLPSVRTATSSIASRRNKCFRFSRSSVTLQS